MYGPMSLKTRRKGSMKQYEKLAIECAENRGLTDRGVMELISMAYSLGFLKAREMADDLLFYASASELEDLDLLRLGEKEV